MSTESHDLFDEPGSQSQRRRKKRPSKQVFKPYAQHQAMVLPPSLDDLIPEKHLVRVVDTVLGRLNIDALIDTYKGGGASAFHPGMLLKVLVYAYVSKVYTARQIAKALRQDIHFMWLAGMQGPDFRTINLFRSGRLREVIDKVFVETVVFLYENKYVTLDQYFLDGTKIAADANKYSYIWVKNTHRHKKRLMEKLTGVLQHIDELNRQENERYGDRDLEELGHESSLTSQALQSHIEQLNTTIAQSSSTEQTKRLTKAVKELERTCLPKLTHYERQERLLAGRNSYSKTDTDATFMRMKDGQLLPAYNVLLGTERQFILSYSVHQKATETDLLCDHLTMFLNRSKRSPRAVIADAAYGSEENYHFLATHGIDAYVPAKWLQHRYFTKKHFQYDEATDTYRCPQGRPLVLKHQHTRTTARGYQQTIRQYQSLDCSECPVATRCKRGEGPRSLHVSPRWDQYYAEARYRLTTDDGVKLYAQRGVENESVFGDLKRNQGVNRFQLRGKTKVNIETGLHSIAHNMKKLALMIN